MIKFSREAEVLLPLTSLEEVSIPEIECPTSGPTHLGEGLKLLCDQAEKEVQKEGDLETGVL